MAARLMLLLLRLLLLDLVALHLAGLPWPAAGVVDECEVERAEADEAAAAQVELLQTGFSVRRSALQREQLTAAAPAVAIAIMAGGKGRGGRQESVIAPSGVVGLAVPVVAPAAATASPPPSPTAAAGPGAGKVKHPQDHHLQHVGLSYHRQQQAGASHHSLVEAALVAMARHWLEVERLAYGIMHPNMPAWWDEHPSRQTVRLRGVVGSIIIVLFCYWVTTLKERPSIESNEAQKEACADNAKAGEVITLEELQKHNHQGDLWIAVDGVVADLTDFVASHPGGAALLLQHAGQEAGEAFGEVGHTDFARGLLQTYAIGTLATRGVSAAAAAPAEDAAPKERAVVARVFTKEDPYNLHKALGFTTLSLYAYRIFTWSCLISPEGTDYARMSGNWWALASISTLQLLQLSSFIFHVPQNRPSSGPMIWQEWRMHNLIFVTRLTFCFTVAWVVTRYYPGSENGRVIYVQACLNHASVFAQMYLADKATAWLRDDSHETLVSTMPYWQHCPKWVEAMFRTEYSFSQIITTLAIILAGQGLDLYFVIVLPYQLYSVLMTFVRKNIITTRMCHVTYFWSLLQTMLLGYMIRSPHELFWLSIAGVTLYSARVVGFNKYALWLGVVLPLHLYWFPNRQAPLLSIPMFSLAVVSWVAIAAFLKLFTRVPVFDSRHARYVEARPKQLILLSREQVSDSLYSLRFQFPLFFRVQGYSSGLVPGQHVRLLCSNPSERAATWNGRRNPEELQPSLSRSYTPVTASNNATVDFLVKDYPPNAAKGFPDGGRASNHLCKELQVGESVWLSGPHGHKVYKGGGAFSIDGRLVKAAHCCGLAGGSGITPILATLRQCRQEASWSLQRYGRAPQAGEGVQDFHVLHANRTAGEALAMSWYEPPDEVGLGPRCRVANLATSEGACAAGGPLLASDNSKAATNGTASCGKLNRAVVEECFPRPAADVVIILCGPKGFVDDLCRPLLKEIGYDNVVVMW